MPSNKTMVLALATLWPIAGWAEPAADPVTVVSEVDQRLARLMSQAREAMDQNNPKQAATLYRQLLAQPAHRYSQEAQEMVGVALERARDTEAAQAAYAQYLKLYPEGEGAERVRQRLAGLTTAAWKPAPKLRSGERRSTPTGWTMYGAFSQYLRQDALLGTDGKTLLSALSSQLDITARDRQDSYDIQTRVSAGYLQNLNDSAHNTAQLYAAYVDVNLRNAGLSSRLGRQSAYGGGVLGRYDGLRVSYRYNDTATINFMSGFPVERSRDIDPDTSRYFYGLHWEYTPSAPWVLGMYTIEQRADKMLDRRAVGGELRYAQPDRYFISFLDYDVSYGELNILSVQGSRTWAENTTFSATLDLRNSPPLTTRNALQGQSADKLDTLRALYTDAQIRALAQDRTTSSTLAMIGLARRVSAKLRLDSDLSVSHMGATPASGGVEALNSTGNEYALSLRATGTDWPRKNQSASVGTRIGKSVNADSLGVFTDARFIPREGWSLLPRVHLDYRDYSEQDQTQWLVVPGFRVEWRWTQSAMLEFDGSLEWSRRDTWLGRETTRAYYVNLGYRWDF